jgi:aminoglycoside N3'-acetyltransferase
MTVTSMDIARAVRELGILPGDIVLVHSSLKSLGHVENGPASVIRGFEDVIGKEGTLVMSTLSQVDFKNSYKTWYMDKPSDVGFITEFFRKQPYVYRSNQATHSVAARGRLAYDLTFEHTARGPHLCPFGEYAFSDSSPWRKMYILDAKIIFLGVNMKYNTFKHLVETRFVEGLLEDIEDGEYREVLKAKLWRFGAEGVWPFYDSERMQGELEKRSLLRHAVCGDASLIAVSAKSSFDTAFECLRESPGNWYDGEVFSWIRSCLGGRK